VKWQDVARRQHGLVSRAQLLRAGLDPAAIWRRLQTGALEEALPTVYRVPGTPRTWLQSLMGVCLWAGDDAVASHRAAAALWGLEGFEEGPLEVTAGKKNQCSARFRVHQPPVPSSFVTRKEGIPVTNAARTLLDLASCVSERRMNQVLDEALRKGLVSLASLRSFVDREKKSGRRGLGVLRELVDQRDPAYQPSAPSFRRQSVGCSSRLAWRSRRSTLLPTPMATSLPVSTSASWASGSSLRSRAAPTTHPRWTGSTTSRGATASPPRAMPSFTPLERR
jgi:hypothetical protein